MKQNNQIVISILVIMFFISLKCFSMNGDKVYSLADLVNMSESIIYGKVVALKSYIGGNGRVFSDIKIEVVKDYKGNIKNNQIISFNYIGGTFGDRTTTVLELPHFSEPQEIILFINQILSDIKFSNAFLITGMAQGKFDINRDNMNRQQVFRDRFVTEQITIENENKTKFISNKDSVLLEEFESQLDSFINQ